MFHEDIERHNCKKNILLAVEAVNKSRKMSPDTI
jgi:hypothetical protein